MKKWGAILVFLMMVGTQAHAFDWFGGRLSLGGGYGRVKPKLPYSWQDSYQDGEMWTLNAKYFINNDFSVVASYADMSPYMRGDKEDTYRFRPIVGSLRYNLFHHLPFTPYLTVGGGYSTNKHEIPNQQTIKWGGWEWQSGLGMEFFITEGASLGVEALYHDFQPDGANHPYRPISLVGMMNIYFGPGPSQRRAEQALEEQKAAAAKAQADAAAAQQQAQAAQAQAQSAQQQQNAAEAAAATTAAAAQQQVQEAQAEVEHVKQMMASKEIAPINFKTGSADLLASSDPTLDKVAAITKKYPALKLRVEGYTDNVGGDDFNQKLSEKRANAIKDYLTSQASVPADQVSAIGYGKGNPVASNDTAEGRAQNRRVEFTFQVK